MEKITRSTFLYMDAKGPKPKQNAQCVTCSEWIKAKNRCRKHRKTDVIDGDDSCCLYVEGPSLPDDAEPLGLTTPEVSGLVSRQVRCENCRFFDPNTEPREHCDLYTQLNRILPNLFDLDRYVKALSCCNAQTQGPRNPKVFGPLGPLGAAVKAAMDAALTHGEVRNRRR